MASPVYEEGLIDALKTVEAVNGVWKLASVVGGIFARTCPNKTDRRWAQKGLTEKKILLQRGELGKLEWTLASGRNSIVSAQSAKQSKELRVSVTPTIQSAPGKVQPAAGATALLHPATAPRPPVPVGLANVSAIHPSVTAAPTTIPSTTTTTTIPAGDTTTVICCSTAGCHRPIPGTKDKESFLDKGNRQYYCEHCWSHWCSDCHTIAAELFREKPNQPQQICADCWRKKNHDSPCHTPRDHCEANRCKFDVFLTQQKSEFNLSNEDEDNDDDDEEEQEVLRLRNIHDQFVDKFSTKIGKSLSNKDEELLLNPRLPFTMVCVGKQGSGKSNTQNVILEKTLLGGSETGMGISDQNPPFGAVAFHFGSTYGCEFLGLCENQEMFNETIVLVSPTSHQRFEYYSEKGMATRKLRFDWKQLSADHLTALMKVDPEDPPLYGSVMLTSLRHYAAVGRAIPPFQQFMKTFLEEECTVPGQIAPAEQRFSVLQNFIATDTQPVFDIGELFKKFRLIIVDLTDPLLTEADANVIFYVILNAFRQVNFNHLTRDVPAAPLPPSSSSCKSGTHHHHNPPRKLAGKIAVFDEAHKFFVEPKSRLCREITSLVEVMRHEGCRVIISTQSPSVIPPGVLELTTFVIIHHLHSPKAWAVLETQFKIEHSNEKFDWIAKAKPGQCLVCQPHRTFFAQIRRRETFDLGATKKAQK